MQCAPALLVLALTLASAAGATSAESLKNQRTGIWVKVVASCKEAINAQIDKQAAHEQNCDCFASSADRQLSLHKLERIRARELTGCELKGQDALIAALEGELMGARAKVTADRDQFHRLGIRTVTDAFDTWSDLAADQERELVKSSVLSTVSALCHVAREAQLVNKGFGPKRAAETIKWLASKGVTEPFLEDGIRAVGSSSGKAQLRAVADLAARIDTGVVKGQTLSQLSNGQLEAVAGALGMMLKSTDANGAAVLGSFLVNYAFAQRALGVITPDVEAALNVPDHQLAAVTKLSQRMRSDVENLNEVKRELSAAQQKRRAIERQGASSMSR